MEMKKIIAILILLLMTGCARVSVKQNSDGTFDMSSFTLWKDIEKVDLQTEEFVGSVGSSTGADQAQTMMALCILFPQLEGCP
jgi:hypothetical protein